MTDIYLAGGVVYMHPLSAILISILMLTIILVLRWVQTKQLRERSVETIRQLGMVALAWGVFSTVLGFFQALAFLSELKDPLPFHVIMGGLKVAMITTLYGFIILFVSLIAYFSLRPLTMERVS
jgi:flagellar motor component MotA